MMFMIPTLLNIVLGEILSLDRGVDVRVEECSVESRLLGAASRSEFIASACSLPAAHQTSPTTLDSHAARRVEQSQSS